MSRPGNIADLCALLGVNATSLRDLANQGIVVRLERGKFDLDASVTAYCAHLRKAASGRGGALAEERARLAKEQADLAALKVAALRGEMVPKSEVLDRWLTVARAIRAGMLALPTRVQQRLPHLTARDVAEIDAEARAVLEELANAG